MGKKLVRLPGANECFELIDPESVAGIIAYRGSRCLLILRGHSEEGAYTIELTQEECAKRLGLEVVDAI